MCQVRFELTLLEIVSDYNCVDVRSGSGLAHMEFD